MRHVDISLRDARIKMVEATIQTSEHGNFMIPQKGDLVAWWQAQSGKFCSRFHASLPPTEIFFPRQQHCQTVPDPGFLPFASVQNAERRQ